MDTNTDESPGHQSQSQQLGNSPSEEEMGSWTPTGVQPKDYDDDDEGQKEGDSISSAPIRLKHFKLRASEMCKIVMVLEGL